MIRFHHILYVLLCCTMFSACSSEELAVEEDTEPGIKAVVPTKYLDGINDRTTRSSISLVGNTMVYNWMSKDQIGVFNVSYPAESSENTCFTFKPGTARHEGTTAWAKFSNDDYSFNKENYWVAYTPFNCNVTQSGRGKVLSYDEINLSYEGQKAQYNATPSGYSPKTAKVKDPNSYNDNTEALASNSLAEYDYLISDPAQPDEENKVTFGFKHVGSTVRFWVLFPDGAFGGRGKNGYITSMDLLCTSGKIVSGVKLAINQYSQNGASYVEVENSKTTTNRLTMNFPGPDGKGIMLPDVEGGCNFITYMEFYPTTYLANECYLYMTVVVDGVERYFKSKPLPAKTIKAGNLYQWYPDAIDPIELTATLQSWQDIVTGLSTDLEK